MPPATRDLWILSQEKREVKVAAAPLVNSFRSRTWRRVTCDTLGGKQDGEKSLDQGATERGSRTSHSLCDFTQIISTFLVYLV